MYKKANKGKRIDVKRKPTKIKKKTYQRYSLGTNTDKVCRS